MVITLRDIVDDNMNMDTKELIGDKPMMHAWRKAVHFYRNYHLFPRTNTYEFSIANGEYVPDLDLTTKVMVDGVEKTLGDILDTQTRVFNGTGTITVTIGLTSDNAYLAGIPDDLEKLFFARCKVLIGQKLKFAKYNSQPFELDGESIYSEGEASVKEMEEFIMINRDEDPNNITDLRNEAYKGVGLSVFRTSGTSLW